MGLSFLTLKLLDEFLKFLFLLLLLRLFSHTELSDDLEDGRKDLEEKHSCSFICL